MIWLVGHLYRFDKFFFNFLITYPRRHFISRSNVVGEPKINGGYQTLKPIFIGIKKNMRFCLDGKLGSIPMRKFPA